MFTKIKKLFEELGTGLDNGTLGQEDALIKVEEFLFENPKALVIMPELREELELIISDNAKF